MAAGGAQHCEVFRVGISYIYEAVLRRRRSGRRVRAAGGHQPRKLSPARRKRAIVDDGAVDLCGVIAMLDAHQKAISRLADNTPRRFLRWPTPRPSGRQNMLSFCFIAVQIGDDAENGHELVIAPTVEYPE